MLIDVLAQGGATWIKASRSESRGMCVEVAQIGPGVAVRHSVTPEDGAIYYTREEFAVFLEAAKNSEFDHLV